MTLGEPDSPSQQRRQSRFLDRRFAPHLDGELGPGAPSWQLLTLVMVLCTLILCGIGTLAYSSAKRSVTQSAHDNLQAIAKLKVTDIERWLDDQYRDAEFAVNAPLFTSELQRWLQGGRRDPARGAHILDHLDAIAAAGHYRNVDLRAATDGALLLGSGKPEDTAPDRANAITAAREMHSVLDDLHFIAGDSGGIALDFYFPLRGTGLSTALAVADIQSNPADFLFPLLARWPGTSPSGETLLLRSDGADLVYLNHPRHHPNGALRLRLPLAAPELLAAQAARGQHGALVGVDYRGVPSLGYALPVAGTTWLMMAKIDAAEIYGPLNSAAVFAATAAVVLMFLATWWLIVSTRQAAARYRHASERELMIRRIDFLSMYANDAMLLTDMNGNIIEANGRAALVYGYARGEMIGMNIVELGPQDKRQELRAIGKKLSADAGLLYETENVGKNGQAFPVEICSRVIELDGKRYVQAVVRDISERKRLEQSLRASEALFRQAFEHAPIGMTMVGLDGRFLAVNPAVCRMTGYSQAEYAAMTFRDVTYPDDLNCEANWIEALDAAADHSAVVEKRGIHKDGRVLNLSINRTLVKNNAGTPAYVLAQIQDVTAHRHAAARIDKLSRLKAAISVTNHAIIYSVSAQEVYQAVCDACINHGRFQLAWVGSADSATQRIKAVASAGPATGYLNHIDIDTRADVAGGQGPSATAYREQRVVICNDFSLDPVMAPWRDCAATYGLVSSIALPLQRGGRPFGMLSAYGPEKNFFDAESLDLLVEMARNISFAIDRFDQEDERRHANNALRRYAEEVADLYQNAPCGYHSLGADGTLLRINDTELRWLGYRRDEVVGTMNILDILAAPSRRIFINSFPRFKASGSVQDLELELVRKDGTLLPVVMSATALYDADGRYVSSRTTIYDITVRKTLEREQARQTKRLEELSHRLVAAQEDERRHLAGELHDRASPNLAVIAIALKTLADTLPAQSDAGHSLADAQALLEDTTEGIRAICAELRPTMLDYAGLIPALEGYAAQFARRTSVAVRIKAALDLPRFAKDVESSLFRIVQEALTNCAKHACAKTIVIEFTQAPTHIAMTIRDDGFGFDPDALGQSGKSPGHGLITMKERAEFIGGRYSLDSHPMTGTEIRIELDNPHLLAADPAVADSDESDEGDTEYSLAVEESPDVHPVGSRPSHRGTRIVH